MESLEAYLSTKNKRRREDRKDKKRIPSSFTSVTGRCFINNKELIALNNRLSNIRVWKKTRIHWLDWSIVRNWLDIVPTYHYVQNLGKLTMQSQENGQKPKSGQFFDDFEVKYLQIENSSEK